LKIVNTEPLKNIELIEAFFEGRLDAEEQLRVQILLDNEPEFKEEFELYKTLVAGIKSLNTEEIKSQLRKIDEELDEKPNQQGNSVFSFFKMPLAVAASLILILMSSGYWIYNSNFSKQAIVNRYYVEDPGLPVLMSSGNSKAFDEAMNLYKLNQYQESFDALQDLLNSDSSNDTLLYYCGVNLLKMEKAHEAIGYFQKVYNNSTSGFQLDAQYRLAVCFLHEGKKIEAEKIFSKIKSDISNPYRESAMKLMFSSQR